MSTTSVSQAAGAARAVEEAFNFLLDDYSFRRLPGRHDGDWIIVPFRGSTSGVDVHVGPNRVGVTLGRLDEGGRMRTSERDDWSHWWWVVQDLVPDVETRRRLARPETDVPGLIREHADALRRHGSAALRGDFDSLRGIEWWEARDA